MQMTRNWAVKLPRWLARDALSLWSTTGIDNATGTAWEALGHDGMPCTQLNRRLRVQVRQAYCLAQSADPLHQELALQLFRFAMDKGFERKTGNLAAWLAPDTSILTAPHDLYDLTFMLLAASALIEVGFNIADDLAKLEVELDKLKAPYGWHENAAHDLPRRQNPHMHLFEASTALFRVTGEMRFQNIAKECLSLFRKVFLQDDGQILEYFDADWVRLGSAGQMIEPGHIAEWIYLIDCFESVTGNNSEVPLEALYLSLLEHRGETGLLPDQTEQASNTYRMWPQTELLKATISIQRRKLSSGNGPSPDEILSLIWRNYLSTPVVGGWYDKRGSAGELLSSNMPASTFYHISEAVRFYLSNEFSSLEAYKQENTASPIAQGNLKQAVGRNVSYAHNTQPNLVDS